MVGLPFEAALLIVAAFVHPEMDGKTESCFVVVVFSRILDLEFSF